MRFLELDPNTLVADSPVQPSDIARAAAQGVTLIVNNRPDGEEPGQPASNEIGAAARAAGVGYRFMPVAGVVSADQVEAMAHALEQAEGKVLAFCRSGTRSTFLWALARASRGADADELTAKAAAAGYDLSPLAPHLGRRRGAESPPRHPRRRPSA